MPLPISHTQPIMVNLPVSSMNMLGVELLARGNYSDALSTFSSALKILARERRRSSMGKEKETLRSSMYIEPIALSECPRQADSTNDQTSFLLYDRAILLHATDDSIFYSDANIERAAAVVVFNMALTHQLTAFYCPAFQQQEHMSAAIRLYGMAHNFICKKLGCSGCSGVDQFLKLAAYNNIAHIYSNQMRRNDLENCIDHLAEQLGSITDETSICFSNEDFTIFYLNAILGRGTEMAPAA